MENVGIACAEFGGRDRALLSDEKGHIASVQELPGLSDEAAVEACRAIFEKHRREFEGYEVWDRSRMLIQHPPLAPEASPIPVPD
jgi:hypothetical protein